MRLFVQLSGPGPSMSLQEKPTQPLWNTVGCFFFWTLFLTINATMTARIPAFVRVETICFRGGVEYLNIGDFVILSQKVYKVTSF